MLADPMFQFNEELARPPMTLPVVASTTTSSSSTSSAVVSPSTTSSQANVHISSGSSTSSSSSSTYNNNNNNSNNLRRPSKLELKVNLNDEQTAASLSPLNPQQQLHPLSLHQQHNNSHDKNNNVIDNDNTTTTATLHSRLNQHTNSQNFVNSSNNTFTGHRSGLVLKDASNHAKSSSNVNNTNDAASTASSGATSGKTTAAAMGGSNGGGGGVTRKKKRRFAADMQTSRFSDVYSMTGEVLGQGAYGKVWTCRNIYTRAEYAVKIIDKARHPNRERVFKEIEIYLHCRDCSHILKIIEFFEEEAKFYVVFEKMEGGPLLNHIERRGHLTEQEASLIVKEIATALHFLHSKGMAHRDLKPENILCQYADSLLPVRICDFDLGSSIKVTQNSTNKNSTCSNHGPICEKP